MLFGYFSRNTELSPTYASQGVAALIINALNCPIVCGSPPIATKASIAENADVLVGGRGALLPADQDTSTHSKLYQCDLICAEIGHRYSTVSLSVVSLPLSLALALSLMLSTDLKKCDHLLPNKPSFSECIPRIDSSPGLLRVSHSPAPRPPESLPGSFFYRLIQT